MAVREASESVLYLLGPTGELGTVRLEGSTRVSVRLQAWEREAVAVVACDDRGRVVASEPGRGVWMVACTQL